MPDSCTICGAPTSHRRSLCNKHYKPLKTYPAEHYSRAECLALIEACGDSWYGRRNAALIVMLWRSGLRLSEALAVTPKDIDFYGSSIRVLHGKGNKARTVGMDGRESVVLREWLDTRGDYPPTTPVICTRQGGPVSDAYVRMMLPQLAKKAGVNRRIHAHGFRHTFAVELSRAGIPVRDIQQLLGHSNLATTSIYLASLSPEEALDAVRKREW